MKTWLKSLLFLLVIAILALGWILFFHNSLIADHLPKWGWVQSTVAHLGQKKAEAPPDDEEVDTSKTNIPVHTAHISVATLHRYVDGYGYIAPRPPKPGQMSGSANIASPIAGVVANILCSVGQQVHKGDPLIQLDDRLAKSAEQQADAALSQAQASLAALKATPRPDQLQIAQLTVDKSQSAADLAEKNYNRLKELLAAQGTSEKIVQQAASDLAAARTDLAIAQKQLALLKSTPTPQELHQEEAKVAQAQAALVTATVQHQMMTIVAPIDATVMSININPGESADPTKPLVQLMAMDRLMVDVDVPADQLPAKTEGLAAQILLDTHGSSADPGAIASGTVSFVSPQVDPKTGAVIVGVDLPANANLRPGLSVRVRIIVEEHKDVLAAPLDAVVTDENGDSVISLVDGDQATHKTVKVGITENGLVEISADGLKEGDTLVTAGAFGLPAAAKVKVLD
jgi:multidrug efflux pump subunit AcrA (membrane-fusion protein)